MLRVLGQTLYFMCVNSLRIIVSQIVFRKRFTPTDFHINVAGNRIIWTRYMKNFKYFHKQFGLFVKMCKSSWQIYLKQYNV